MSLTRKLLIALVSFLFSITQIAFALESDKTATLHITSNSGSYNFKTGVDVYEGNVIIDQGTTHITADKLITKKNAVHKIKEATAYAYGTGKLAHFWTLSKVGDPEIHAYAKLIKFYPIDSNVVLEQDVHVKQGDNSFQGEVIHYNSSEQTITLPASLNARAVLVYNPDK